MDVKLNDKQIEKIVEQLTAKITDYEKWQILLRNPAGCYVYVRLWADGEISDGLSPSWCAPAPDAARNVLVWSADTPYDSYSCDEMPFGLKRDDESESLFLVDKQLADEIEVEVDGVTGYLSSADREDIEDGGSKILLGLDWDADDYLGDDPLVDEDYVRAIVKAFCAGDRERVDYLQSQGRL